jgi:2-dehydropantoate 2-reductase
MTRVAVIGAGAMGGLYAAHFAEAGADVWAYDIWREHVAAISRDGLRVQAEDKERRVAMKATSDPREPGVADVALVMVKFRQTPAAVESARPMIGPDTLVLTLQNGIGNVDAIRAVLPSNRILFGFTTLTSNVIAPGTIKTSYARGPGETFFWPADGHPDAACEGVAALLTRGRLHGQLAPDIELRIWKKLVVNCCYNPLCAMTGQTVGELIDRPEIWPVLDGITDELVAAATRKGLSIDREDAGRYLRRVGDEARGHFPSMVSDMRLRRLTEIDAINGAVLRESEKHGLAAPLNRAMVDIIHAIEARWPEGGAGR